MPALPIIAVVGAPGTGVEAVASDLQRRLAPQSAQVVCATTPAECLQAALTLLMGLDLPCPPAQAHRREVADAQLRTALAHAGVTFQVVYGLGERRIENALKAIKTVAASAYGIRAGSIFDSDIGPKNTRQRAWNCEKCCDPECEHRLFTALVGQREAPAS